MFICDYRNCGSTEQANHNFPDFSLTNMILRVHMLGYNPFLFEDMNWGEDFFARLRNPTAVYITFFPNDKTQILFPDFDDTPPILYHKPELINTDLLFTLPWLNISNVK